MTFMVCEMRGTKYPYFLKLLKLKLNLPRKLGG
jgi:hypothetical protein